MRVNATGNSLFTGTADKTNVPHKVFKNTFVKNSPVSVRVSISDEGKKSCRNGLQGQGESLDRIIEKRNELLSGKIMPEINYSFELGNKLDAIKGDSIYRSTIEKANDLVEAYANVYDEIVQGYQNGTREIYVQDSESEDGYRKLTMGEELNSLDKAYKKYTDFLEVQAQLAPEIAKTIDQYVAKLSKIGSLPQLASQAKDVYVKAKEEAVPEHISDKLVNASKAFAEQYTKQNNMDIRNILEGIKIID